MKEFYFFLNFFEIFGCQKPGKKTYTINSEIQFIAFE
jgi:hypothetical protein